MQKKYIILIAALITNRSGATKIYIKNFGIKPVTISELSVPKAGEDEIIDSNISIQPGQSMPLTTTVDHEKYDNFNHITLSFDSNGYAETETIYFPDEITQEASLSFNESGYKRSPFNIIGNKK